MISKTRMAIACNKILPSSGGFNFAIPKSSSCSSLFLEEDSQYLAAITEINNVSWKITVDCYRIAKIL
jgi:hypothetical protein